ncbi:NAD(P)/FAD-dependent oxidoreductase [Geodermatophilus sp. SYSU D01045]
MSARYDAVVVGARCAGAPTAMLLARRGWRVLLVDRARFPSDTLSCHFLHQSGVASLVGWGLHPVLAGSPCPPIRSLVLDTGTVVLRGTLPAAEGASDAYAMRRTVLDAALVDAAAAAGAEVRESFDVRELLTDDDRVTGIRGRGEAGRAVTERASVVIGADGMRSTVARAAGAPAYHVHPSLTCAYYSYWRDVEVDGLEIHLRPGHLVMAAPTSDGQVFVVVYWRAAEFSRVRRDVEGSFGDVLHLVPDLATRLRTGTRTERFRGTNALPNFYRRPHGPGWALVGDAGHHQDPVTGLGMTDAFRDAELVTNALHAGFSGAEPLDEALAAYERRRNESTGHTHAAAVRWAELEPLPPGMQLLAEGLRGDPVAVGRLFGTAVGTVPPSDFFSEENLALLVLRASMQQAAAPAATDQDPGRSAGNA